MHTTAMLISFSFNPLGNRIAKQTPHIVYLRPERAVWTVALTETRQMLNIRY